MAAAVVAATEVVTVAPGAAVMALAAEAAMAAAIALLTELASVRPVHAVGKTAATAVAAIALVIPLERAAPAGGAAAVVATEA